MKKYVTKYILLTSTIFSSRIIMNLLETKKLLSLLHPYNVILAMLSVAGLVFAYYNEKP